MRRIVSILVILLVLIVGANPTLAMHYCGNDLRWIELQTKGHDIDDCCTKAQHEGQGQNDCPDIEAQRCCLTKEVSHSVDNYQSQARQLIVTKVLPSNDLLLAYSGLLSNHVTVDDTTAKLEYFPPEGLNIQNTDILTLICVYRL